jgi:hypothetical protein
MLSADGMLHVSHTVMALGGITVIVGGVQRARWQQMNKSRRRDKVAMRWELVIAIGGFVGILGGLGSSHFNGLVVREQHEAVAAYLRELKSNLRELGAAERAEIAAQMRKSESLNQERLRAEYPGGYGLLRIDGSDGYVLPRSGITLFEWTQARILGRQGRAIVVMLPGLKDEHENVFAANAVAIPPVVGFKAVGFEAGRREVVVEVLEIRKGSLTVAVGVRPAGGSWRM